LEDFSERRRFLAFYPLAAAFFVYFFLLKKKSKSLSGWRIGEIILRMDYFFPQEIQSFLHLESF